MQTRGDSHFAFILPATIFTSFDGCAVNNEIGFREELKFNGRSKGFVAAAYEAYSFSYPVFTANYDRALVVILHQGLKSHWLTSNWSDFEVQDERSLVVLKKQSGVWVETAREQI